MVVAENERQLLLIDIRSSWRSFSVEVVSSDSRFYRNRNWLYSVLCRVDACADLKVSCPD